MGWSPTRAPSTRDVAQALLSLGSVVSFLWSSTLGPQSAIAAYGVVTAQVTCNRNAVPACAIRSSQ